MAVVYFLAKHWECVIKQCSIDWMLPGADHRQDQADHHLHRLPHQVHLQGQGNDFLLKITSKEADKVEINNVRNLSSLQGGTSERVRAHFLLWYHKEPHHTNGGCMSITPHTSLSHEYIQLSSREVNMYKKHTLTYECNSRMKPSKEPRVGHSWSIEWNLLHRKRICHLSKFISFFLQVLESICRLSKFYISFFKNTNCKQFNTLRVGQSGKGLVSESPMNWHFQFFKLQY